MGSAYSQPWTNLYNASQTSNANSDTTKSLNQTNKSTSEEYKMEACNDNTKENSNDQITEETKSDCSDKITVTKHVSNETPETSVSTKKELSEEQRTGAIKKSTSADEMLENKSAASKKLELFKKYLAEKEEERKTIVKEKKREMEEVRLELEKQKEENRQLKLLLAQNDNEDPNTTNSEKTATILLKEIQQFRDEISDLKDQLKNKDEICDKNRQLRIDLANSQQELQKLNTEFASFEKERSDYKVHVAALKEVIKVSKQMLEVREAQLLELRSKISDIEQAMNDRETQTLSTDLRLEYERQLTNIKNLKTLYEERARIARIERENMSEQLEETKQKFEAEHSKNCDLQQRIEELETDVSEKQDAVSAIQSELGLAHADCKGLRNEMTVINQLFSQILLGFNNSQDVDLDKLIKLLEENHDLLTDIVINEESPEISSALPKVLLDLVNQISHQDVAATVQEKEENIAENSAKPEENACQTSSHFSNPQEIANNLPKVWRILTELLSQQSQQIIQPVQLAESYARPQEGKNPCYKSVETPSGKHYVLSVSKTYTRLKDLILEKKSLQKDMTKLKQLNNHLEQRLQDQEKRLGAVSMELSKTWHMVGRLQRQHQQLHTHEKILRYELSQKRKMLNELKEELEYCREKWEKAREKNCESENQCQKLRTEFASRKLKAIDDSSEYLNNSGESGYSDEQSGCSSEEESDCHCDEDLSLIGKAMKQIVIDCQRDRLQIPDTTTFIENTNNNQSDPDIVLASASCQDLSAETNQSSNSQTQSSDDDPEQTSQDQNCEQNQTGQLLTDQVTGCISKPENSESVTDAERHTDNSNENTAVENSQNESCHEIVQKATLENYSDNVNQITVPETMTDIQNSDLQENVISNSVINENHSTESNILNTDLVEEITISKTASEYSSETKKDKTTLNNDNNDPQPSCSKNPVAGTTMHKNRTPEEILSAREARIKRLEEQCKLLVRKVSNTSARSVQICTRLETLHEQYGSDSPSRETSVTRENCDETNTTPSQINETDNSQNKPNTQTVDTVQNLELRTEAKNEESKREAPENTFQTEQPVETVHDLELRTEANNEENKTEIAENTLQTEQAVETVQDLELRTEANNEEIKTEVAENMLQTEQKVETIQNLELRTEANNEDNITEVSENTLQTEQKSGSDQKEN